MLKTVEPNWISVNYNATMLTDTGTWKSYRLESDEKVIDRNVIWLDWKIQETVPNWLVEITRDGVRELLTLSEYVSARENNNDN